MNNRERAQQIADEHGNDAYSVALAMLEEKNKIKAIIQTDTDDSEWKSVRYAVSSVGGVTDYAELSKSHILEREKLKHERDSSDLNMNKIKAEAVQSFIELFIDPEETSNIMYDWLKRESKKYANKLENQND